MTKPSSHTVAATREASEAIDGFERELLNIINSGNENLEISEIEKNFYSIHHCFSLIYKLKACEQHERKITDKYITNVEEKMRSAIEKLTKESDEKISEISSIPSKHKRNIVDEIEFIRTNRIAIWTSVVIALFVWIAAFSFGFGIMSGIITYCLFLSIHGAIKYGAIKENKDITLKADKDCEVIRKKLRQNKMKIQDEYDEEIKDLEDAYKKVAEWIFSECNRMRVHVEKLSMKIQSRIDKWVSNLEPLSSPLHKLTIPTFPTNIEDSRAPLLARLGEVSLANIGSFEAIGQGDAITIDVTAENFEQIVQSSFQAPVLLYFWAPSCGACKSLGPILEKLANEYAGTFILAKINTDDEQMLADHLGIRSLPTVMLIKDGQQLDGFMGAQPEGQIRAMLEQHCGPHSMFSESSENHEKKLILSHSINFPWFFDRLRTKNIVIKTKNNKKSNNDNKFALNNISTLIAQILYSYKPGTVRFLLIDPVGLGKNFSEFHKLSDYDERLISSKVWSDRRHIREQLDKLVEHISGVIQKYLRSDYESIETYNEAAGEIAEPYRFVFIFGFPENFDTDACLALERIMANGARCGVHVILVWDQSKELPHGISPNQIIQQAEVYQTNGDNLKLASPEPQYRGVLRFKLDTMPDNGIVASIVENHGSLAKEGSRVEVPYETLMQRAVDARHGPLVGIDGGWVLDNSEWLAAPLGPTGARKIQSLVFGEKGTTAHHALIIGKPGSGKSNLLHVLILSLAEIYAPEQLEVFLLDFKKGVEFKDYATHKLPHARVVAIASELEFGLSVLRGLDEEMTRRGELFRAAGVQELVDFRTRNPDAAMSRILMIADEFHELFIDEGTESREALAIVERMVRQGRSFGMHLVLASQSIAGIRLPRSILDQIGVRIALQCSEAESRLVLADDNPAARLLDRAGEAIFNDKNGLIEGNNLFQVALLSQDERNRRLAALHERAHATYPDRVRFLDGPFVFEGSEPAHVERCRSLNEALRIWPPMPGGSVLRLWVGEPIAMLPAHAVELKRQSGGHLLVVDRDERLGFGVVFSCLLSMVAQETPESINFHIVDLSSENPAWANHPKALRDQFPHKTTVYGRREIKAVIEGLAEELTDREQNDATTRPRIVLVLFGLQRARDLRREEGFSFSSSSSAPSIHDHLQRLLREGPEFGVHVIIWCDTLQNLTRILDNAALNEIGHRVSGSLSSSDSMKLFDDPVASKIERENRMICYDDEKVGVFTQIRPYLPCDLDWLQQSGSQIYRKWKAILSSQLASNQK